MWLELPSFVTSGYPRPSALIVLKGQDKPIFWVPSALHLFSSHSRPLGRLEGLLGVRILCDQTIHSDRGTHPFRDRLVLCDKETTYQQWLVGLVGLAGRPQNTLRAQGRVALTLCLWGQGEQVCCSSCGESNSYPCSHSLLSRRLINGLSALEEIVKDLREPFVEDLDAFLREADEGRARELQEGSSHSVVHPSPRVGSERWRKPIVSIGCVWGAAGESKELLALNPMSKGAPWDVLQFFEALCEDLFLISSTTRSFSFLSFPCTTTPWPEHVVKLLIMQPSILCLSLPWRIHGTGLSSTYP